MWAASMIAHFYNDNAALHGGSCQAVYNCKQDSEGRWVQDLERGVMDGINPQPWQTDTSIGDWFYRTGQKYKTSARGHPDAGGHRQQERQPAHQHGADAGGRPRTRRAQDARRDRALDRGQRRGHLRHPAVEGLW